ncbi:MAG: GreA/GreB family elongation factor [Phycisphaerales bacterium]|nr:MAG: GreA/GreB family elongation factor [Phycisphaerales bacterium]
MMQPESLAQLAESGNVRTVEEEWMRVMESADLTTDTLASYDFVLKALRQIDKDSQAGALAWAAVETVSARFDPVDTLRVAGPFLLAVGDNEDLRTQVAQLYRQAYSDREGLESLMSESGIEGGRPVRRALRTLEVCLALDRGAFLSARDEDDAARVDEIDISTWDFTITTTSGQEVVGAVHLADRYEPADTTDFAVMRQFNREQFAHQLQKDPAAVVIGFCRDRGNRITSDELASLLAGEFADQGDWRKWWTRARTSLKRNRQVQLEGRSPYVVSYLDKPVAPEDSFLAEFATLRDPIAQWSLMEKYVQQCKVHKSVPPPEVIRQCWNSFQKRAKTASAENTALSGMLWLIVARTGELGEVDGAADEATAFLKAATDLDAVAAALESDALMDIFCRCLVEARPDDWQERLLELLPVLPTAACERAASQLLDAGTDPSDLDAAVARIMASPIAHFDALLWLWGGPSDDTLARTPEPTKILTRILRALDDARRSDELAKDTIKRMNAHARSTLSANKHDRFVHCLEGLEAGLASTLRNQLSRTDALGRALREDLLRILNNKFPPSAAAPKVAPWAREDVLFVTEAGLTKKQAEIDHHVNVKMRENAKAIGRAAAHGDLSENAEYKFALEERDLLRARLAQMNAEVEMATVITPEDVPTDQIGIGTRAVFRNVESGKELELAFVGPWEADAEKGFLNYKAPLPQKLMGLKVGEVAEFDLAGATGEHEIVRLSNTLEE